MSVTGFEISELRENISVLKAAYTRAAASGGVTSYTISSGQGSTTVQQASLNAIKDQLAYWQRLLNEELEYGSGSHCTFMRDAGVM